MKMWGWKKLNYLMPIQVNESSAPEQLLKMIFSSWKKSAEQTAVAEKLASIAQACADFNGQACLQCPTLDDVENVHRCEELNFKTEIVSE